MSSSPNKTLRLWDLSLGYQGEFILESATTKHHVPSAILGFITLQWLMCTQDVIFMGQKLNYLSAVSVQPILFHLLSPYIRSILKYLSTG